MSWKNTLKEQSIRSAALSPFKITPEVDELESEWIGSIDIFKNASRIIRVSVKSFPDSYSGTPSVYIYQKLFKWDISVGNYLKQSQVAMTLLEFKLLQDNLTRLDEIIDSSIIDQSGNMPPSAKKQRRIDPSMIQRQFGFTTDAIDQVTGLTEN